MIRLIAFKRFLMQVVVLIWDQLHPTTVPEYVWNIYFFAQKDKLTNGIGQLLYYGR